MNEAARFFRYLAPATLFLLETAAFLLLCCRGQDGTWPPPIALPDLKMAESVVAVLLSAGIGYLLSILGHRVAYGSTSVFFRLGADFRPFIRSAMKLDEPYRLRLVHRDQRDIEIPWETDLRPEAAWRVVTCLWELNAPYRRTLRSATAYAKRLTDIFHGAAASLCGALLAIVVLLLATWCSEAITLRQWYWLLLPACLLLLHLFTYTIVKRHNQGFNEMILWQALFESNRTYCPKDPCFAVRTLFLQGFDLKYESCFRW